MLVCMDVMRCNWFEVLFGLSFSSTYTVTSFICHALRGLF
ncbi:hypothetical protein PAUR_a0250 [Pseudoalteromonas aurantia 208]|uniref:Uncharacterized protein n=1 Tax=Pseudoalteromonas aurantia 208 TaxID=1314867 RepID=A0ABR9E7K2_9GAMM|nr:hypothetical protein [Pseudoalteromonas aurantia 208]